MELTSEAVLQCMRADHHRRNDLGFLLNFHRFSWYTCSWSLLVDWCQYVEWTVCLSYKLTEVLCCTAAQEILASIIFLFVKHAYDVGDR